MNNFDSSQPFLGPIFILLKISGLLPSNYKCLGILNMVNNWFFILLVITQFIDLCELSADKSQPNYTNLLLTNLRYTCVAFATMIKWNSLLIWKPSWQQVFEYIVQTDLEDRQDCHPKCKIIVHKYTKYSKIISYGYCTMTFGTAIAAALMPLVIYNFSPNYAENYKKGLVPFPHIFSVWVPFDKNTSPGCWIVIVWNTVSILYGTAMIASFDITLLVIMNYFEKKLDLIKHRCKLIYKREEGEISDEVFLLRISQRHNEHNLYIKNVELFNSLVSPVLFFYVLVSSLLLCTSIFQLSMPLSTAETIMNLEILMFGTIQIYMCCWYSNDVYYKSLDVSYGPYTCDWWALDAKKRRMILLLIGKLRKTVVFTAGPFTELKFSTFITIVKGAYSYYTLLRE